MAPPLPPGRHVELPGRGRLFVREAGPVGAPPVVLLHGWTVTSDLNWFDVFGHLDPQLRVIAFDHRGHGRGLRPVRPVRITDLADDVVAVLDALAIERADVVGYSLGGAVAQVMARDHADRLRGLVLAATMARFRASDLRLWPGIMGALAFGTRVVPRSVVNRVFDRMVDRRTIELHPWAADEVRSNHPRMMLEAGASLFNFDSRPWLGSLTTPTAVVVTEEDRKVPAKYQRKFADWIPGATLHPLAGGHDASVAKPAAFAEALHHALASVAGRAAAFSLPSRVSTGG